MAAPGLARITISPPATGYPAPSAPAAGFHDVFTLTTGPARRTGGRPDRPLPERSAQTNSRGDLDDG
jgi:hypothetical protein